MGDISQVPEGLARNAPPALLRFFGGPTANLSVIWWFYVESHAFSVPRLVLWLFSRVFWGSGGPTVNLSCFPWAGGPTVNLPRYLLLSAGCRWPRGGSSLRLVRCCVCLVVPRQPSRVFRGLVVLR